MIYRKAVMTIDVTAEEGAQEVVATLSTDTVDRDREVVKPSGIDLRNYNLNPVVLFCHDMTLPVARALYVRHGSDDKDKDLLLGKIKFSSTSFAQDIFTLYQEKVLRAFSIGFMPLKGGPPEEKEILEKPAWAKARWVIRASELYEFSCVSVPANPEALATAVSKGMLCAETLERLKILDPRKTVFSLPKGSVVVPAPKKPMFKILSMPERPKARVVVLSQ